MSYTLNQLYGIGDQVIVVTGAARGIGLKLCRTARDLGGGVAAIVRNSESREKVLEALHCLNLSTKKDILCVIANLTHEEAVEAVTEQTDRHSGRIGRLVNITGVSIIESLEEMTLNDSQKAMDANLTSVAICRKHAGGCMLKAKKDRIVNISSPNAVRGKAHYTAYASSRAAMGNFTRVLAIEWAQQGTNVNSMVPGMIVTDINRKQIEENPRSYKKRIESIPRGYVGRTE